MNKFELLSALRSKCGYQGTNKNEDIVAFYEANKDSIVLPSGIKSINEILSKTVTISVSADAGEEVAVDNQAAEQKDEFVGEACAPEKPMKSVKTEGKKAYEKSGKVNASAFNTPAIHSNIDRKNYQAKIDSNKSYLNDVDAAEYFGAWMRLNTTPQNGIFDYSQKARDTEIVLSQKAGSELVAGSGSQLVFAELNSALIWRTELYGVARKVATVYDMKSDSLEIPRQTALPTGYFAGDNAAMTASDPTSDKVSIFAKKYYVLSQVSRELLDDSAVNIADMYGKAFVTACQKIEDQCAFIGTGAAAYGNMVGLVSTTNAANYTTSWAATTLADFEGLRGLVSNVESANLAFICSRQYYYSVMSRLMNQAGGNTNITLSEGLKNNGVDALFLGTPVYFSQVLPITEGSSGEKPVYFGDIKNALFFGSRKGIEIAQSNERYFDVNAVAFRAIDRFGINFANDGQSNLMVAALKKA